MNKQSDNNDIPQYIYDLSDEEKMLLISYRVLSKENKEELLNKLKEIKEDIK